jgi:CRP/FNR family transcriptional regulator, cyclic AMP receptor protein
MPNPKPKPTQPDADPCAVLPEPLRRLAVRGELKRYRKGVTLIHEGDQGDTLFILLRGRVRVFGSDEDGREITYGDYGAGEFLGEIILDGGPRSASVITLEPTDCVQVTRHTLLQHIAEHPEFAFDLLANVIRRVRAATLSTKHMALNGVYERLVALLNQLAQPQADGTRLIAERLTHQEMANRLGCSREMVSRLMKDLDGGGYTSATGSSLILLRPLPARW